MTDEVPLDRLGPWRHGNIDTSFNAIKLNPTNSAHNCFTDIGVCVKKLSARPGFYAFFLFLEALFDVVQITLWWFWERQVPWSPRIDIDFYPRATVPFYVQGSLSCIIFILWGFRLFLAKDRKQYLFTISSLFMMLTSVPSIISLVTRLAIWIPFFLRIWDVHHHTSDAANKLGLCGVRFQYWQLVSKLMVAMMLSLGVVHSAINFTIVDPNDDQFSGGPISVFESFYFTIVTFSTVGYGDIKPFSIEARLCVVFVIFVALWKFPAFFTDLADISRGKKMRRKFSSRHGNQPHVVIAGQLSTAAIRFFVNEFCGGTRRHTPLSVVVLNSVEYDSDIKISLAATGLSGKVFLLRGSVGDRAGLEKCDAGYARCIFLTSSDDVPPMEADAQVMLASASVYQFDKNLPQHVVVKRSFRTSDFILSHNPVSILDKSKLRYALLGLGSVSAGACSLISILLRSTEIKHLQRQGLKYWADLQQWSIGNQSYTFDAPAACVGRPFMDCALVYRTNQVTVIGVVTDGKVQLNPKNHTILKDSRFVAIASHHSEITSVNVEKKLAAMEESGEISRLWSLPNVGSMRWGGGLSGGGIGGGGGAFGGPGSPGTPPMGAPLIGGGGGSSGDPFFVQHPDKTEVMTQAYRLPQNYSSYVSVDLKNNDHEFKLKSLRDHVVLIDLWSAQRTSQEAEGTEQDQARGVALFNVMRSIKLQDASLKLVLLSRGPIPDRFDELWRGTGYSDILHVEGCGLYAGHLNRVAVHRAKSCLVFSSAVATDEDADTITILVTASIESVCRSRGIPSRQVQIVSEIQSMDSLTLLPPFYNEDRLAKLASDNFAFQPSFITGRVVCVPLLDAALFQVYFNPEILSVIDALIYGNGETASLSSMPVPAGVETYRELEGQCMKLGFLPLGLHRKIVCNVNVELNGFRFLYVNPSSNTKVSPDDHVYFLL